MAFEGLSRAWSNERVAHRDATFCVVDKPAGMLADEVTGKGSKDSLPVRLLAYGLEPARPLVELPQRASGAMLLAFHGARVDHERVAARLELTFVAALEDCRLPASGALVGPTEGSRLVYRVLRRQGSRALVELSGRVLPAQVASVLASHGQPLVGDAEAGAPAATRLMLHVSHIRGPVSGGAPLPVEFDSWLAGHAVLPPERFAEALERAALTRVGLAEELGALRLLDEEAGELSGVSVERYGDHAVLLISTEEAARHELMMADCLMDHGALGVYVKRRVRTDLRSADRSQLAPSVPLRGSPAPDPLVLRLGSLAFEVSLGDGLATGLFLDQRANWGRVRSLASGGSFLNLFCYTGPFTVSAAAGGAASTVSVDLAGRALSRLAANLDLNTLSGEQHRLLKADVPAWLARARRAQRGFDLIVLDPPSFGTRSRGVLSTKRDGLALVESAIALLEPNGSLLTASHHRKISSRELAEQVRLAAERAGVTVHVEPLVGGWDCPTIPGVSGTKSVLARRS
jgi:23S rRNA G2069 N7-methylase RlmK/C1962 C5-methylase RlmI